MLDTVHIRARAAGLLAIVLLTSACGEGEFEAEPTPTAAASEPSEQAAPYPAATDTPSIETPDPSAQPSASEEPPLGPWRDVSLPGYAQTALNGFDGGVLAFVSKRNNMRDDRIDLWSVAADGSIQTSFGNDGRTVVADGSSAGSGRKIPALIGAAKHEGALLVGVDHSGGQGSGPIYVERIRANGSIDEEFHRRQGDGYVGNTEGVAWSMAVLPDGSTRICLTYYEGEIDDDWRPHADLYGVDASGQPDARLGPRGFRRRIVEDAECTAIATTQAGDTVIASGFMDPSPRLFAFDAHGRLRDDFGQERLGPEGIVGELSVGIDGAIYVTGLLRDENGSFSGTDGYVARADASGHWDRAFGDNGLIRFGGDPVGGLDPAGERVFVAYDEPQPDPENPDRTDYRAGVGIFDTSGERAFLDLDLRVKRTLVRGDDAIVFGQPTTSGDARLELVDIP